MQVTELNQEAQNTGDASFSIELLEDSLRLRLDALAFDAKEVFEYSAKRNLDSLQQQLELQFLQLPALLNEMRALNWLKEQQPTVAQQ